MRALLLVALGTAVSATALGEANYVLQTPVPSYPEFNSYVTNGLAQQNIRSNRRSLNQLPALPSQDNLVRDHITQQAPDRASLYYLAQGRAQVGASALHQACVTLIPAGTFLQFPLNPPYLIEAGKQMVRAGLDHCNDLTGYCNGSAAQCTNGAVGYDTSRWSARRLNQGGFAVTKQEDTRPAFQAQPNGITPTAFSWAQTKPGQGNPTSPTQPAPYTGQDTVGAPTIPPVPPTTARPNLVYNTENPSTDPVGRDVRSSILPDSFIRYLDQNGVNGDSFRQDFANGQFQDAGDILRAMGVSNFSDADLEKARAQAEKQFPKIFQDAKKQQKEEPEKKRDARSAEAEAEGIPLDAFGTPRVKKVKDKKTASEEALAAMGQVVPQNPKLPLALVKKDAAEAMGASPEWFQWLGLGVFAPRKAQNIFHIAHREFQNFAPMTHVLSRGVALLNDL